MPTSFAALTIALLAVVPGYLARMAWSRGKTFSLPATDLTVLVQSIAASLVLQVLLAPVTIPVLYAIGDRLAAYPWRVAGWAVLAVVIAPLVGGYCFGQVTDAMRPGRRLTWLPSTLRRDLSPPAPSIWDHVHLHGLLPHLCLLVIEFRDGRRLAGAFGSGSEALTSPQRQGVFLVEEWAVGEDGLPTEPIPNSGGVVVTDLDEARGVRILIPAASARIEP